MSTRVAVAIVGSVLALGGAASVLGQPALVKDINPGPDSSYPYRLAALGDAVYFGASDGLGVPWWRSDGTEVGTAVFGNVELASEPPRAIGGTLWFTGIDTDHGAELWRTDGTMGGTVLVRDIIPGQDSSYPQSFTGVGSTVFFDGGDVNFNRVLYKTDGTTAGTVPVKIVYPPQTAFPLRWMTSAAGLLFFTARDANGEELWRSDGTDVGTSMVKDIYPGWSSSPRWLTAFNGKLYFLANSPNEGEELWESDGTAFGTRLVMDIFLGWESAAPEFLVVMGDAIYFAAWDASHGRELWRSDGTAGGTFLVRDINPGSADSEPLWITSVGSRVVFSAFDPVHGRELWASDGTAGGTVLLADIYPGPDDSYPQPSTDLSTGDPVTLTVAAGTAFFQARDGVHGNELWASDGTPSGTVFVADINPGPADSTPEKMTAAQSRLFFVATEPSTGRELWSLALPGQPPVAVADGYGTSENATLIVDAASGVLANDSDPDGDPLTASLVAGPANGLVGLSADGSFDYVPDIGFVGVDSFTYEASDGTAVSAQATVQIFVAGMALLPVAGTITPIPGGTGTFTGFPAGPALNGPAIAFLGSGAGGQAGVYASIGAGSPPLLLADFATPIPGGTGTFSALDEPQLSAQPGDPCREAAFVGGGAGGQMGIYATTFGGASCALAPAALVDLSTSIPGGSGTFAALGEPALSALPGDPCHELAFVGDGAGGQQGIYVLSFGDASCAGAPAALVDLATSIPGGTGAFTALHGPALHATPGDPCHEVAFLGDGTGGQHGVYALSFGDASCAGTPAALVDLGTSIPGGSGTFTAVRDVTLATIPGDPCRKAAFVGDGDGGQQGIYSVSFGDASCSGSAIAIADRATAIPQGLGSFTGFLDASASGAHVAFLATGSAGQKGIYLASTLTKVIDLDDTLDGKALADIRFARSGLSGNRLAFAVTFTDGSEGVYTVTVDFPGANDAPLAVQDGYTTPEAAPLVVAAPGVLANDSDAEGDPLTTALVTAPMHGSLLLASDGSFTYTPAAGFTGVDRFTYTASDGSGGTSIAAVTLTVVPLLPQEVPDTVLVDRVGAMLQLDYEPACGAADHAVFWGASPIAGALAWTSGQCGFGTTGQIAFDPGLPAPGQFHYFVIVGQSPALEGSFGQDSTGNERPEALGLAVCELPLSLAGACP